jgi:hypothetical protein
VQSFIHCRKNFSSRRVQFMKIYVPSGGVTLIVWTQNWGFSCKVQRRPPADIFLDECLPPKTPCGHHVYGRHGHGSPVKNRWRFSKFIKNTKLWPSLKESVYCKKMGLNSWHWSCLKVWFKGYTFCLTIFFGQTIYWSTAKPWTSPKKCSNDLERSNFCQQVQSFVRVPSWSVWPSNFGKCSKMP